jgi:hypothetical protein
MWVLMRSMNRPIFRFPRKNGNAAQPGHVSSSGRGGSRKGQGLDYTAGGVGLPISTFPSIFSRLVRHEVERCRAAKLLCRASARIVAVFPSMLGLNASIAVGSDRL